MTNESADGLVKIHIAVSDDTFEAGGESAWAKPLGNDLYEIRNTLWHSCDINWGDVVRAVAERDSLKPEFIEVVRRGGHRTAHLFFFKKCPAEAKSAILEGLKQWKASYENANGQLYAVDVDPNGNFDGLCGFLDKYEREGEFTYRTIVTPIGEGEP